MSDAEIRLYTFMENGYSVLEVDGKRVVEGDRMLPEEVLVALKWALGLDIDVVEVYENYLSEPEMDFSSDSDYPNSALDFQSVVKRVLGEE